MELLARNGVKVIACDRKERAALGGAAAHYEALGAVLHLGEGYLRDLDADVVFRTPGMRPDVPELLEAKAHGAVITSEMEAFFAVCPCPILGVTGSDGKTTTASVIAELLKAEGNYVMPWVTNFQPNVDAYREAIVAAMNQYDNDPTDANWEQVKTAFVDGWAVQYAAANG